VESKFFVGEEPFQAAAAEEVVYEVVAEPQGQAPQKEDRGESAQGPTQPSVEQQT